MSWGGGLGPIVYEKKPIKQSIYIFFLLFLLSYGPLFYIINKISFLKVYSTIFYRLYLGLASIGVVFLLNIIFELFDLQNVKKFLRYLSSFTLEIYVVHLTILRVLQYSFKFNPKKVSIIFIYSIILSIVSIILSRILNIVLYHVKMPEKKC